MLKILLAICTHRSLTIFINGGIDWMGFTPLNPTYSFCLDTKSKQKRSRLRPSHSKNLRSKGWNRPNSLHRFALELKQCTIFNRFSSLFFGSSVEVGPHWQSIDNLIIYFHQHQISTSCIIIEYCMCGAGAPHSQEKNMLSHVRIN